MKVCVGEGTVGAIDPAVTCANFRDVWQVWQGPLDQGAYMVVVVNR